MKPISARVAILGATSRCSPYLADAINSLKAQSFEDWCFVLVDDGSPRPEALEAAVEGIRQPVLVVHQAHRGVAIARNLGLSRSDSEYVVVFDDDDVWATERLLRQVITLQNDMSSIACHTQFEVIDSQSNAIHAGDASSFTVKDLLNGSHHPVFATVMVRRNFVDMAGWFNSNFSCHEDLELLYRLSRLGSFHFLNETLYYHRRHGENATNNLELSATTSMAAIALQVLARYTPEGDLLASSVDDGISSARRYWSARTARESVRLLREANIRGLVALARVARELGAAAILKESCKIAIHKIYHRSSAIL